MKLQTEKKEVTKSEEFETINYGVATDNLPLLFQMLRTNLYSDIHGSIVRELVSNVIDAHTEAGKKDAIGEVEWVDENRLLGVDCQLIIRDFGIGLSPDRMKNIYGNYLSSTKRDSNDAIGGFGLGSKVPFAYTDSFFVRTRFDGKEYKYLCYIDETQLGAISTLEIKDTGLGNSTEIIVPVKNKWDKSKFQDAIYKQLSYFHNIKYINFTTPNNEVLFENEHCVIIKQPPYSDVHIVLGNVAYPIDFNTAGFDRYNDGLGNCQIGLKFKIGELQPTLSRESIFWNESVKKKVHARVAVARKSIREAIEKDLEVEKDYAKWYAAVSLQKSKKFPAQWGFARVKTDAVYKPSDGSADLPIKTTTEKWFAGLNLKTVTPWRGYRRSSKVASSKNPDYSTSSSTVNEILNYPTYRVAGTLSSRKSLYLFKTYPDGFVVVQDVGLNDDPEHENDIKPFKPYYNQGKAWRSGLPSYDDIVVPDGECETTSDDDYKEAYRKLVAQRKLEGKFVAKVVTINTNSYGREIKDYFQFSKYESKFEDHKTGIVIYGTQENEEKLFRVAAMLTYSSRFVTKHDSLTSEAIVLKVAQHYLKQFGMMVNAYEINDVLAMKTELNKELGDIATAYRYEETIDQFKIFNHFDGVNTNMRDKFVKIHKFIVDNTLNKKWHETGLLPEILALCDTAKVTNKEMDAIYAEIDSYVKGAELLKFVSYGKGVAKPLRDYLTLKGKAIDPEVIIEEKEPKKVDIYKDMTQEERLERLLAKAN